MLYRKIYRFFDKFEDKVRGFLSRFPIAYAIIGGTGIVLFWRGVWITADLVVPFFFGLSDPDTLLKAQVLDGPVTILFSSILLLATGLMVSQFIGNEIIISGITHDKKLDEKEVEEIASEEASLKALRQDIKRIREALEDIKTCLPPEPPQLQ